MLPCNSITWWRSSGAQFEVPLDRRLVCERMSVDKAARVPDLEPIEAALALAKERQGFCDCVFIGGDRQNLNGSDTAKK